MIQQFEFDCLFYELNSGTSSSREFMTDECERTSCMTVVWTHILPFLIYLKFLLTIIFFNSHIQTLTRLDLYTNQIGDTGARHIADGLKDNKVSTISDHFPKRRSSSCHIQSYKFVNDQQSNLRLLIERPQRTTGQDFARVCYQFKENLWHVNFKFLKQFPRVLPSICTQTKLF